jgi:hypothetical protein
MSREDIRYTPINRQSLVLIDPRDISEEYAEDGSGAV